MSIFDKTRQSGGLNLSILLIIIISGLAALGGYQYYRRQTASKPNDNHQSEQLQTQIKIMEGNVVLEKSDGDTEILVNKDDFTQDSVTEFTQVNVSPDGQKICFLGATMAPTWMYYADVDGSNAEKTAVAKNCVWSPNSQKIAFNNHTTDVSPVNVLVYDLAQDQQVNLTKSKQSTNRFRIYQKPRWVEDSVKLRADFETFDFANPEDKVSGTSEIDLELKQVSDL